MHKIITVTLVAMTIIYLSLCICYLVSHSGNHESYIPASSFMKGEVASLEFTVTASYKPHNVSTQWRPRFISNLQRILILPHLPKVCFSSTEIFFFPP